MVRRTQSIHLSRVTENEIQVDIGGRFLSFCGHYPCCGMFPSQTTLKLSNLYLNISFTTFDIITKLCLLKTNRHIVRPMLAQPLVQLCIQFLSQDGLNVVCKLLALQGNQAHSERNDQRPVSLSYRTGKGGNRCAYR